MKRQSALILLICFLLASCTTPSVSVESGEAIPELSLSPPRITGDFVPKPVPEPSPPPLMEALAGDILREEILIWGETGEYAIRAAYHWLIQTVWFGDPVGLDVWRYLSDETKPIPYLENRAFSPFRFHIGSCEDFAAAMVLLLRAAGFEAEYVAGYTLSVDQIYIDHAWAVVRLDGEWYHIDPQLEQNVTRNNTLTYRYYLKSDREFALDHKWGENLIAYWPEMPHREKQAIRELYTPPVCAHEYPRPEAVTIPLPLRKDLGEIETEIIMIKKESGKGELPPVFLHVEPPVLVSARHITPPLLDQAHVLLAPVSRYGRSFLSGGEAALYDELLEALSLPREGLLISIPEAVTDTRAIYVANTLLGDEPLFYWASLTLTEETDTRYLKLSLSTSPETIERQRRELDAKAFTILNPISGSSPFEKVLAIHDILAAVDYDRAQEGENSGNVYGALLEGKANCNGYAHGFQYLASLAGLENAYIRGRSLRGTEHAWNAVKLDGAWHFSDSAWDRPLNEYDGIYHDYFLISKEEMLRDRFWDETQYPALPDTESPGFADYYTRSGYTVTAALSENGREQSRVLAEIFYRRLKASETFPSQAEPVFLELKIQGNQQNYSDWKEAYVKQVFHILEDMGEMSDRDGQPFEIIRDTAVKCDFNDTMRVLIFYPNVREREAQRE